MIVKIILLRSFSTLFFLQYVDNNSINLVIFRKSKTVVIQGITIRAIEVCSR